MLARVWRSELTTLIPAIGSCASRMTAGERRFANRLEDKLEDDYLCWYDVSIGERTLRPDFVVFHPGRGLLVLEVKDWKGTTILRMNYRNTAEILGVARAFADELLTPSDTEEDHAPTGQPMSAGRHGPSPLFIKLPSLQTEAEFLATRLT